MRNDKSTNIDTYIDKAVRADNLDAIKKLDAMGIEIDFDLLFGDDWSAASITRKITPKMLNCILGSDNLFACFKDDPRIRLDLLKSIVTSGRGDLLDVFIKHGGMKDWPPDCFTDLHEFIIKDCNRLENNPPDLHSRKRPLIAKALSTALPFGDDLAKNPYPLLMCAVMVSDADLIAHLVTKGPISLAVGKCASAYTPYTHADRNISAKRSDARYLLSDIFIAHASFSEKMRVIDKLSDLGLDLDLLAKWHNIDVAPRFSRDEDAAEQRYRDAAERPRYPSGYDC